VARILCVFLFALCVALTGAVVPAAAQAVAPEILSADDVETYRGIFAAQDAGDLTHADTLIAALQDDVLMGYVLHQRYMGRYYTTSFQELSSWMSNHADHVEAERIYALALRKKPGGARNPAGVSRLPWRGERFEHEASETDPLSSPRGEQTLRALRDLASDNNPQGVERAASELRAGPDFPQIDVDRLRAYVSASYLAERQDADARRVAETEIARGALIPARLHWIAGLASYRSGDFAAAAAHFESVSDAGLAEEDPRNVATGAFWAARAQMRLGEPAKVLELYQRAAARPFTFYGALAARVLGRDPGMNFEHPVLDAGTFALMMRNGPARRAVALYQIGRLEPARIELERAYGEMTSSLDPPFAALARAFGATTLELRAAETAAARGIYLTSLYPVPPYEPEGGFRLDQAMTLAIARLESRFNPEAISRAGARGLMQIMPGTAAYITKDQSLARANNDRLDDPSYSMRLGEEYLQDLLQRQNGNLFWLAASYNAGYGNLTRWQEEQGPNNDPVLFIESIPVPETRDYVKRMMMNIWMYQLCLGEEPLGMDAAAAGDWPVYPLADEVAAAQ